MRHQLLGFDQHAAVTSFADALEDLPGLRAGARAVKADAASPTPYGHSPAFPDISPRST